MSAFEPAPSRIVVVSPVISTFFARPSCLIVTSASVVPRSFITGSAPVSAAMSPSIAFRRSP